MNIHNVTRCKSACYVYSMNILRLFNTPYTPLRGWEHGALVTSDKYFFQFF